MSACLMGGNLLLRYKDAHRSQGSQRRLDPLRPEKTLSIPMSARFPVLVRGTDLSYALFVSVAFALVIYFLLWHTAIGYEVRAAGLNPTAARYGGIRIKRTMFLSFVLGGIAAGRGSWRQGWGIHGSWS